MHDASESLGRLVDYFRDCDEPTIIVFYGDHMAGLGQTKGGPAYSELGLVPADREQWDLEERATFYSTDYLIWSNDPAYLPEEPGTIKDSSCNYLGVELLKLAEIDLPLYWQVINRLSQTRVADTGLYHLDRSGELTEQAPDEGQDAEGLALLRDLLNDAIYGTGYVTEQLGQP